MKEILIEAYQNPNMKFCYFTAQNDETIAKRLNTEQWDWTPQRTINIEPYYWNTHTIAMAFSCGRVFTSEGNEWIKPLISNPEDVHHVKIPDIYSGRTGEILKLAAKLKNESSEDTLIRLPDIQSPLGVCELMWDQSFYLNLLTNLDEIKILLDKISQFIISYIKEFQAILGDRYNPACHPHLWSDPDGYYISDDANSMVSPEMHLELSINYINWITSEIGPLFYHTCTLTDQYLDNIKKLNNVKAINWSTGTSMDPAEIIKHFSGEVLLAPHLGLNIHKEECLLNLKTEFNDEVEVFKYFLDNMLPTTMMNIVLHDNLLDNVKKVEQIYTLFKEYCYLPNS
jgi:hypothetical protein